MYMAEEERPREEGSNGKTREYQLVLSDKQGAQRPRLLKNLTTL